METLNLLKKIEEASTEEEKLELSRVISFDLQENAYFYKNQIEGHFTHYFQSLNSTLGSFNAEMFHLRIEIYTDLDYLDKIAIGISFVPERRTFNDRDEDEILDFLESEIHKINLENVVNDISVNSKQRLLGGGHGE